eukprot:415844-Hanusia_phi.AAC.6
MRVSLQASENVLKKKTIEGTRMSSKVPAHALQSIPRPALARADRSSRRRYCLAKRDSDGRSSLTSCPQDAQDN